jgi:hypothetical protein
MDQVSLVGNDDCHLSLNNKTAYPIFEHQLVSSTFTLSTEVTAPPSYNYRKRNRQDSSPTHQSPELKKRILNPISPPSTSIKAVAIQPSPCPTCCGSGLVAQEEDNNNESPENNQSILAESQVSDEERRVDVLDADTYTNTFGSPPFNPQFIMEEKEDKVEFTDVYKALKQSSPFMVSPLKRPSLGKRLSAISKTKGLNNDCTTELMLS